MAIGGPDSGPERTEVSARDSARIADLPEPVVEGEEPISEERAQKIIQAFESESPTRELHGFWRVFAGVLAAGLAIYALYWTQINITTQVYRASFLMVALALTFLLYPLRGRRSWVEFGVVLATGLVIVVLYLVRMPPPIQERFVEEVTAPGAILAVAILAIGLVLYALLARRRSWVPAYDIGLVILSIASLGYLVLNYQQALQRIVLPTPTEVLMGILVIVLVLEATRRTTGWILSAVAVGFLIYAYFGPYMPEPFDHRGYSMQRIVAQNYLTLEGIFGVPLDVAATFIILFTIYGAVLEYSGAGKFFLDWAFAALGRSGSGSGPGRTVTAAGFLLGTVSGSGVATTVTLGSLSWPMLRRAGYDRETAGGILAAAGIGALLSPPTLGAAAFLIAEYLDMSYLDVLIMATIPTILYYLSCLLMIEADSRRMQTHEVDVRTPPLLELTLRYGYHFTSLFAIVIFMVLGMTAFMAVFWSIVIAFALSFLRPETRLTSLWGLGAGAVLAAVLLATGTGLSQAVFWGMMLAVAIAVLMAVTGARGIRLPLPGLREPQPEDTRLLHALEAGGRGALSVAATTAAAGLIVSVVTLTGLGLKLSGIIVALSAGIPFLTILYAAIAVWVLGLAVPVTASYIIAAVMIVPALTTIGVLAPAAHMFVFYYAVLADVSPPTALSPFAAAAITGGNPFRTMMLTWKYCLPAFLVPFMFTMSADGATLLLLGEQGILQMDLLTTVWTFGTACLAVAALAVAFGGWIVRPASMLERALMGVGGLALLYAHQTTDLVGGILVLAALAIHLLGHRRTLAQARS
jgi:TRAP transporter 4TM/12TM fusion protein